MLFYKASVKTAKTISFEDSDKQKQFKSNLAQESINFYENNKKEAYCAICYIDMNKCNLVVSLTFEEYIRKGVKNILLSYLDELNIEHLDINFNEITMESFKGSIRLSEKNDYVDSSFEIYEMLNLENRHSSISYEEKIYNEKIGLKKAVSIARKKLMADSFVPELERIFSVSTQKIDKFYGHPVHYLISATEDTSDNLLDLLMNSLISNNRLLCGRVLEISSLPDPHRFNEKELDNIYKSSQGGTILISCLSDYADGQYANANAKMRDIICKTINKYKQNVLTIILLENQDEKCKNAILDTLGDGISIIELKDDKAFTKKAMQYLKNRAIEKGIENYSSLIKTSLKSNQSYNKTELDNIFNNWYESYLRADIYSAYREIKPNEVTKKVKPKGNAYKELEEMIGLTEAKAVIKQALDYFKAQKLYESKGLPVDKPAMHMVFTGNPGTAKTTFARLVAQIMKDNDLLSVGDLHEVGRADLVGQYVGWTADIVKKRVKRAKGSVLFIDEAYSLVDDKDGMYGDEAINTLVQEMENAREDTVIIFAGYPDKMEQFLAKNPGLRSRIAFHINFPDYNTDEMTDILKLMVKNKGMEIDFDAIEKAKIIIEQAKIKSDFGNGRFVRNILEKAKMKQATRLIEYDIDTIDKKTVSTLLEDDFEIPKKNAIEKYIIGFGT